MRNRAARPQRWRQAHRVGAILIVLALLAVSPASNAIAQSDGSNPPSPNIDDHGVVSGDSILARSKDVTVLQNGEWIRWQYANDLGDNSNSNIYRGKKNDRGGCSYSGSETASYPSGETVSSQRTPRLMTIERQTAERSGLCIMITEEKVLGVQEAIKANLITNDELNIAEESHHSGTSKLTLESHLSLDGSIKIYYEDPPQIDVTSVTTNVSWSKNSSCITSTHKTSHWGWFSGSGWQRKQHRSNSEPDLCHEAWKNTYGKYKNGTFCLFVDTWTELSATYVVYNSGNSVKASWDADKWGGCTFLLSFQRHFIHPW